jgi:hypothetical protein
LPLRLAVEAGEPFDEGAAAVDDGRDMDAPAPSTQIGSLLKSRMTRHT